MEEYLQNMKNLRSQMNDVEEEAAKRSAEEQKQKTEIDTIEKDLQLVKSESKRLNEETDEMMKAKAQICCQILDKQRKISSMEIDSVTLSQTLELLQQEMVSVSMKLKEKRAYYTRVAEELSAKLRDQQVRILPTVIHNPTEWFDSYKEKMLADIQSVEEHTARHLGSIEENFCGAVSTEANPENTKGDETNGRYIKLMAQLESAEPKLEEIKDKRSKIAPEISKSKQLLEQLKQRIEEVPAAIKEIDLKALEEEHNAVLADKTGETEYSQSLHDQIEQLKSISHDVKCQCGEEYKVELKD